MKKIFVVFITVLSIAVIFSMTATDVQAAGDKVRGDESVGPSNQNGECPFGDPDWMP